MEAFEEVVEYETYLVKIKFLIYLMNSAVVASHLAPFWCAKIMIFSQILFFLKSMDKNLSNEPHKTIWRQKLAILSWSQFSSKSCSSAKIVRFFLAWAFSSPKLAYFCDISPIYRQISYHFCDISLHHISFFDISWYFATISSPYMMYRSDIFVIYRHSDIS